MKKGDRVTLCIKKMLQTGAVADEKQYLCQVLQYDDKRETISLLQNTGKMTDLSLDAIYACVIETENEQLECTGRIEERYHGEKGKTVQFKIENGFYKINLK